VARFPQLNGAAPHYLAALPPAYHENTFVAQLNTSALLGEHLECLVVIKENFV